MLWVPSSRRVFRQLLIRGVSPLRDMLTTVFEIAGCALVVAGVAMLSVPVSVIVAGVLMVTVSYLVAER